MDNEKRRKLLNDLRNADLPDSVMCDEAADEIERLVEENGKLRDKVRQFARESVEEIERLTKEIDRLEEENRTLWLVAPVGTKVGRK